MSDAMQSHTKKIDEVLRHQFGLNPESHVVMFEFLLRSNDPERYDRAKDTHENQLATRLDRADVDRRVFYGDDFAVFLECSFPRSEISDISPYMSFHYPICTLDEIARIERPANSMDFLLSLRANAIADSPRLTRVFLSRRARKLSDWSLTSYFDRTPIEYYLNLLAENDRMSCEDVAAGIGFLREPNGVCMRNPLGDVLIISESLKSFLYYMNAFIFYREDIPGEDAIACLMIAIRTMFMTEALDFDIDPRGDLPDKIHSECTALVSTQLGFVVGHEFAHHLLGHLDRGALTAVPRGVMPSDKEMDDVRYYSPRQKEEFEADAGALLHVQDDTDAVLEMLNGATYFFLCLDVFYAVSDYISPKVRSAMTHPSPIDRIWALRKTIFANGLVEEEGTYSNEQMEEMIADVRELKDLLIKEFVPFNVENMEWYGSIYLPSFRKAELFDRIDF